MQYLTWQRLTLVGLIAVALAWLVTVVMESGGAIPARVPWTVMVVCAAAGVFALWMGWQVRRYLKGDRPNLDAMRAARTAVFAQACAFGGAIIAGALLGYALGLADEWSHGPRRDVIVSALLSALAGAVMLACGAIAEHWCRSGGDDDDADRSAPSTT